MLDPDEVAYANQSCRLSITHRRVTQLFLDVMLSPLGKSGVCGQPLTPAEVKGIIDFLNLPPHAVTPLPQ